MESPPHRVRSAMVDRLLRPIHRWIWRDGERRVRKLLRFSQVEGGGGQDILRAAETTPDPLLRRLYLAHAIDELHHSDLFRQRGAALLRALPDRARPTQAASGDGLGLHLDDLRIEDEPDDTLLAFLHVAEKAAASRFTVYRQVVQDDPATQAIFDEILHDEIFHMNYSYTQLQRVSPRRYRRRVWRARAARFWKSYLRVAAAVAGLLGELLLTILYFAVLPPFAWLAKRAARREQPGWVPISSDGAAALRSQY